MKCLSLPNSLIKVAKGCYTVIVCSRAGAAWWQKRLLFCCLCFINVHRAFVYMWCQLNSNGDLAKLSYSSFAGCEQNLENALLCERREERDSVRKLSGVLTTCGVNWVFVPLGKDNLTTVVWADLTLQGLSRDGSLRRKQTRHVVKWRSRTIVFPIQNPLIKVSYLSCAQSTVSWLLAYVGHRTIFHTLSKISKSHKK